MVEKLRIFQGATELAYYKAEITKTDDSVIDTATIETEADSSIVAGATIDFKKADGSTTVFSADVVEIKKGMMWTVQCKSKGYELQNIRLLKIYENKSPEYIVEDIVDNYTTGLTFASTETSGFTITKYIGNAYLMDIIKDMMEVLDWQLRIDELGNVYFEPRGNVVNGAVFTNGSNIDILEWSDDLHNLMNHAIVKGAVIEYNTSESFSGDGSTVQFTLQHKPLNTVQIIVDSTEVVPTAENSPYTVDTENKQINFSTGNEPATGSDNVVVNYSFGVPVKVEHQDDDSISSYTEIEVEFPAPWIDNFSDARRYAKNLVNYYCVPLVKAKANIPGLDWDRSINEQVELIDTVRSKSAVLVIRKIVYKPQEGVTYLELGTRDFQISDWQGRVEDRIKKIERRFDEDEDLAISRLLQHKTAITLTESRTWKQSSPVDSFILGHNTLGRLRSSLNLEADCSNNYHNGTWQGTGIDGSQYTTSGWRLSAGTFNGSDNYVTTPTHADLDITGDITLAFAVKVSSLPGAVDYILNKRTSTSGYTAYIYTDNKIGIKYIDSGDESLIMATNALTTDTWYHYVFVKNGTSLKLFVNGVEDTDAATTGGATISTNSETFNVGRYISSYYTGQIDEVMVWNAALTDSEAISIYTKLYDNIPKASNCKLYWSFDNPRLGDRSTTPTTVT